jgi:hypothetical protein
MEKTSFIKAASQLVIRFIQYIEHFLYEPNVSMPSIADVDARIVFYQVTHPPMFFRKLITSVLLLCAFVQTDIGQVASIKAIDDRLLVETKWKYTYTLHLESNTTVHQAVDAYQFFLYFKYDYTCKQFLNGKHSTNAWSLQDDDLFYNFRNLSKFKIAKINEATLVLEFAQPNSKGTYQYHFVKATDKESPFVRDSNELPEIIVHGKRVRTSNFSRWLAMHLAQNDKNAVPTTKSPDEIEVELVGGGYYGGIDPVLRDYIQIKNTGRLIKEFKSQQQGLLVSKRDIAREELEQFAQYCVAQGFFKMNLQYDCTSGDCQSRKLKKPMPIPLRLSISYGGRKKVITVSIWGRDDQQSRYVDYPPQLDNIVNVIQKMAFRANPS